MSERVLLLVRHGETEWNAERRLQGNRDIALSQRGREQAAAISALVRRARPDHVVCSPLVRARETLDLIGLEPDVVDDRWAEADLGSWTGQRRDELVAAGAGYEEWRAGRMAPPGGEALADVRARVGEALAVAPRSGTVLVVTHGGTIRAACTLLVGLAASHLVPVSPGSLTSFDRAGEQARLLGFNVTPDGLVATRAGGARQEQSD